MKVLDPSDYILSFSSKGKLDKYKKLEIDHKKKIEELQLKIKELNKTSMANTTTFDN